MCCQIHPHGNLSKEALPCGENCSLLTMPSTCRTGHRCKGPPFPSPGGLATSALTRALRTSSSFRSSSSLRCPGLIPPGASVCGILRPRTVELAATPSSRGSSWPRDWPWVSCIGGRILCHWATWEAPVSLTTWAADPSLCRFLGHRAGPRVLSWSGLWEVWDEVDRLPSRDEEGTE